MQTQPGAGKKVLYIKARQAKCLKVVQMIGRQDPYLKLWVGRAGTKVKTHVHEDGGKAASWEKDFVFDIKSVDAEDYLYFEVKNKNVTDSKTIGMGKVPLKTFEAAKKEQWLNIYCGKGKPAGAVLLEGRIESSQGPMPHSHQHQHIHGSMPHPQQHHPPPLSSSSYPSAGYGGYGHPPPAAGFSGPYHPAPSAMYGGGGGGGGGGFGHAPLSSPPLPGYPRAPPPPPTSLPHNDRAVASAAPQHVNGVYYSDAGGARSGGWDQARASTMSANWGTSSAPQAGPAAPYHAPFAPSAPSAPPAGTGAGLAHYQSGGGNLHSSGGGHVPLYNGGGSVGGGGHSSLPPYWEEHVDGRGRTYYVNHMLQNPREYGQFYTLYGQKRQPGPGRSRDDDPTACASLSSVGVLGCEPAV